MAAWHIHNSAAFRNNQLFHLTSIKQLYNNKFSSMAARKVFGKIRSLFTSASKLAADKKVTPIGDELVQSIAITDDGRTIVSWHPDVEFPYECSKPIPKTVETNASLLKEEALQSAMRAFKDKNPEIARQELMNLTHTTKHRWFPRARDKRAKKTPMDRPYL